jgi:hypothetical protein
MTDDWNAVRGHLDRAWEAMTTAPVVPTDDILRTFIDHVTHDVGRYESAGRWLTERVAQNPHLGLLLLWSLLKYARSRRVRTWALAVLSDERAVTALRRVPNPFWVGIWSELTVAERRRWLRVRDVQGLALEPPREGGGGFIA